MDVQYEKKCTVLTLKKYLINWQLPVYTQRTELLTVVVKITCTLVINPDDFEIHTCHF